MSAPAQDSLGAIRQTAAMPGLRLDLVEEEASLPRLAREWQCLLSQMARPSPFLSFPWITTWWRHFGRGSRLFIVIARGPGGELVGAAPLHIVPRRLAGIVTVRSLEFIGYCGSAVCADHLDFLAPANARAAVTAALMQELLQRRQEWDALVLADLAEDSLVPAALRAMAPALASRLETGDTCYYRGLPASVDELWQDIRRFHPKLASNVKYYRKRLQQRHQVQWVAPVPAAELDSTLEALARLHGLAHGRKDEAGNFGRPEYRAFHQELIGALASDRALYLARLDCDRQAAAVLYGFVAGEVLYFYQSGFDPALGAYGVGTLLLAAVFEDAITRLGAREFDFLRGAEEYKKRWTSTARHTQSLYAWQPGWPGRLSRGAITSRRRIARWRNALRWRRGRG